MKKRYRIMALFLAILMVLSIIVSAFAKAGSYSEVFAYGAGLNEKQIEEVAGLLGVENKDVKRVKVGAEDLKKYVKEDGVDGGMISSVYIVKDSEKFKGVTVEIKTPQNITEVGPNQYANAAITAGIVNSKISVGANWPVTGTSALTGIYKAFEETGEKLDEKRLEVANEELIVVNEISQEHKDDENFSQDKLNKAIIEVKEKLIKLKDNTGDIASKEELQNIVDKALSNQDLKNIVNNINVNNIVNYFENFQNSSAIDSKEVLGQLKGLFDDISKKAGDALSKAAKNIDLDKVKDAVTSDEAKGFFRSLLDFFRSILDGIGGLFS